MNTPRHRSELDASRKVYSETVKVVQGGTIISFESGRKLGLTASLIQIIAPVLIVVTVIIYFVSIISTISSNPSIPSLLSLSITFTLVIIFLGIMTFVGIILFIVGMHHLSQYYGERAIFKNILYGFILYIIGIVSSAVIEGTILLESIKNISPPGTTPVAAAVASAASPIQLSSTLLTALYYASLAIGYVLVILSGLLYMRAFDALTEKSGNGNFKTAGVLYIIGLALTIVLIGSILVWVAWILAAIGFHSLKSTASPTTRQAQPLPPPPPPPQM